MFPLRLLGSPLSSTWSFVGRGGLPFGIVEVDIPIEILFQEMIKVMIGINNDNPERGPYVVVSSDKSDNIALFFDKKNARTTIDREVFRTNIGTLDFVYFDKKHDIDALKSYLNEWKRIERTIPPAP